MPTITPDIFDRDLPELSPERRDVIRQAFLRVKARNKYLSAHTVIRSARACAGLPEWPPTPERESA